LLFRYSTDAARGVKKLFGKMKKVAVVYTAAEHKIRLADIDADAVRIIKRLQSAGYESYIVGGAVRDLLLGKTPKDFDITTAAEPNKIRALFRNSRLIGRRFKLIHIFFDSKIIEAATFRSGSSDEDANLYGTAGEDVRRRDFTLNALFYDPCKQQLIDYIGGVEDIRKKLIVPIIPLDKIFLEDPVRMLRAVKYAASCNFTLPRKLLLRIKKDAQELSRISDSRLTEELSKIIYSKDAAHIIEELCKVDLYKYLQHNAGALIKRDAAFKEKYIGNFTNAGAVAALQSLYRDYVDQSIDWAEQSAETYGDVFRIVRTFIAPMNPPRILLEKSLRALFAEHGIKAGSLPSRQRNRAPRNQIASA
jgi:poly(A) polymerase